VDWASAFKKGADKEEEDEMLFRGPSSQENTSRCSKAAMKILSKIPCCGNKLAQWFDNRFNVPRVKID
jgi:hypothetical protein